MHHAGLDIRVENLHGKVVPGFVDFQAKNPNDRKQLLHQIPTVNPNADMYYTVTEFDEPTYG
ncbi:MAG: hypothetical protein GF364_19330, partial [Candidatus Lokiarchaeota archaeon]|nr:hypothetical protein [Candidatus Lokiarchaeota archaeon]